MQLIIVESPTKAKTIARFLDKSYRVESSFGHIRDLPKSEIGIDIENGFSPRYVIPNAAKKKVANLKAALKKSDKVILASDEDREGEAIAWHLCAALKLEEDKTQRIVFHEITKEALLDALKNPRQLNKNLVDAQQARRVLDRLVGYELSPFLWKKVARGLSAGRVQSVATRMIVEREKEIQAFIKQEYWSLSADFSLPEDKNNDSSFKADLYKIGGKTFDKLSINKKEAEKLKKILTTESYQVAKVESKKVKRQPSPPFTTSTLQQTANHYLGFSAKQTMTLAQKLYEEGFITYMRTDALNLSPKFIKESALWLKENLGTEYAIEGGKFYKNKSKNAQEAHEAIRPTEVSATPENLAKKLDKSQEKLYRLIWQRAVASQMPAAEFQTSVIDAKTLKNKDEYIFRANGQVLVFSGYLKVWPEKNKEQLLPTVTTEQDLDMSNLQCNRHETNPPARYSDAGLVKELEKYGIGRPSTYAPTISTIITRNYVIRDDNKRLEPTPIATLVSDLLTKHFPQIIDYQFTAKLEDELDEIAKGEKKWQPVIEKFYRDWNENLKTKYEEINKKDIMPEEKSQEKCDKCGAAMIIKTGRYGKFLACSAFPECKNIKGMDGTTKNQEKSPEVTEMEKKYETEVCDKCGAAMKVRVGRFGPFLACSAYPKCKNIKNIDRPGETSNISCPLCKDGKIVKKFSRRGPFYACNNYPACKNAYSGAPTGKNCPDCQSLLIKNKDGEIKCSQKDCSYQA